MNDGVNQSDRGSSEHGSSEHGSNDRGPGERGDARDVVLTKLLDGRATSAQWRDLRAWTSKDAADRDEVWDDLIAQSEQNDALVLMVGHAAAQAERVGAERVDASDRHIAGVIGPASSNRNADDREHDRGESSDARRSPDRPDRLGWLVAAVLAVGFVTFAIRTGPIDRGGIMSDNTSAPGRVPAGSMQAGLASGLTSTLGTALSTPDEALGEYLRLGQQKGQVLGELPQRVVLQSRELGGGNGREVLYLRQIVERAVVKDMYKLGTNDVGEAVMVPSPDWTTPTAIDQDDQHVF